MTTEQKHHQVYTIVAVAVCAALAAWMLHTNHRYAAAAALGMILGILGERFVRAVSGITARIAALLLVLVWLTPDVGAQAIDPGPVQPLPGWNYDFTDSLRISMPPQPGQDRNPVIIGAICVGAAVGLLGYIGVKIISACVKIKEQIVTNNAACGECPLESPEPTSPVPAPPEPGSIPVTAQCSCDAPAAADQPLPLRIEHSFDTVHWQTVATGVGVNTELILPDTGYWRAVPMFLSISSVDGQLTVHAPPGVLEFSSDMRTWTQVAVNRAENTDLAAAPGFYRVRLN